jgi:hypothetical protein
MTDLPHVSLYRRATILALVLASILFVADNLIHPKEYAPDHEAEQLQVIADHYTRWQIAHVLGLGTILLFTVAVLGLAFLVRRRAPSLGLWGGALGVLGLLGFATVIGLDGYSWAIVGEVSGRGTDPRTAQLVLHDLQQSNWSLPYYLPALGFLVGLLLLAIGLVKTGAVAPWVGVLFGAGSVLVGLEGAIHANAFFITGAVVLALGSCAVAAALAGLSDDEFATGGPAVAPAQAGIGSSASAP